MKIRASKRSVLIVCVMSIGIYLSPLDPRPWGQLQALVSEYSLSRLPDRVLFGLIGYRFAGGLNGERSYVTHLNKDLVKEAFE